MPLLIENKHNINSVLIQKQKILKSISRSINYIIKIIYRILRLSEDYQKIRSHIQKGERKILSQLCVGCNHIEDLDKTSSYVHL